MYRSIIAVIAILLIASTAALAVDITPPTISSVTISAVKVAATDIIHVTVSATDDYTIGNITADSLSLLRSGMNIWEGDIPANPELGNHTVTVIAKDGAGNSRTNYSCQYTTIPVYGIRCNQLLLDTTVKASDKYLFKVCGKATYFDENSFYINDGSLSPVRVIAIGHTVCDNDIVAVRGTLDPLENPALIESTQYQIIQMTPRRPVIDIPDVINVGKNLQVPVYGIMIDPTPIGANFKVKFETLDLQRILLSRDPNLLGSGSVTVTAQGGTKYLPAIYVQGLTDSGTANIKVTAPGCAGKVFQVNLTPSGFVFFSITPISATVYSPNSSIYIYSARLDPISHMYAENQYLRGGISPVSVPVISSNPAVGTITTSPVIFKGNTRSASTAFDPKSEGTTTISLGTPAGFASPANLCQIPATVTAPKIGATDAVVGKNLQETTQVALSRIPGVPTNITVTVGSPDTALLSKSAESTGASSITFTGITSTASCSFYVYGINQGTTTMTVSAPGYDNNTKTITVNPSGFIFTDGYDLDLTNYNTQDIELYFQCGMLDSNTLEYADYQHLRPGLTVNVPFTSSNPSAGIIVNSPVTLTSESQDSTAVFRNKGIGATTVTINPPTGFSTPSSGHQITATVKTAAVYTNDEIVGRNLQVEGYFFLDGVPSQPVNAVVSVGWSSIATVSASPNDAGSSSITLNNITSCWNTPPFYIQGRSVGSTTLQITVPGFGSCTKTITVYPSGFVFQDSSFETTTINSDRYISVAPAALYPTTLKVYETQSLRSGMSVNVPITSSNTTVGTITTSPLNFTTNMNFIGAYTAFHPVSPGACIISIGTPSGFSIPSDEMNRINAVVTLPKLNCQDVNVGRDMQKLSSIFLNVTLPSPPDMTVSIGSPDIAIISKDSQTLGSDSVTFNGVQGGVDYNIYVQGKSCGQTILTLSAPGYATSTYNVNIFPSGFIIDSPGDFSTSAQGLYTTYIYLHSVALNPSDYTVMEEQKLRPGVNVSVPIISSDPIVGIIIPSPVVFTSNASSLGAEFDPVSAGTTRIKTCTPAGFSTPANKTEITATVTP